MERKKNFRSSLGTAMTRIFAIGVGVLVIVVIAKTIAGDWKLIVWVLGTIFFVGFIAWRAGCFQRKNK